MADQLQNLYSNLEARVAAKTKSLAEQNERLATLYDMAAFLNSPNELEELGRGFLRRLMTATGAAAGSIRLVQREPVGAGDAEENRAPDELAMYLTEGLDSRFVESERCLRADACACGDAMSRAAPIVHLVSGRRVAVTLPYCREAGFATVTAFPIVAQGETIGIYNLFFREARELAVDERHMLETLGQHLGVTMLSRRLAEREREMAISEERNLLAQELHDSIAQSLAFLNLQVQMLRDAIGKGNFERAREDLDGVQAGVQETYSDVRELLTHFRTRLGEGSLEEAIRSLLHRFEHQTGLVTRLRVSGAGLSPPTEAQLQILHIAQEALSNARKHAEARTIDVDIVKGAVYRLVVRDDGRGFDPEANRGADHVGLLIMRERAQRVGASLAIRSAPGGGAEVTVELPLEQRQAA
jgi:two-component system nitrate/nitrite sensor histidine kinase NarX